MSFADDILENARRLRDDAKLLFDAQRYASCGLLQVICLEELGKAYLTANSIPRDPKLYHRQKQEAAISLSAAVRMHRLLEETCDEHGWNYWGNMDDAEKYYEWMASDDGRKAIAEATKKVSSWLRVTRHGVLEKLRLMAAYIDEGPNSPGSQLEGDKFYTYRAFDRQFSNSAFDFIDAGFECLEDERISGVVELFRTVLWKPTIQ
jgi:AbiV family abortive infection protein